MTALSHGPKLCLVQIWGVSSLKSRPWAWFGEFCTWSICFNNYPHHSPALSNSPSVGQHRLLISLCTVGHVGSRCDRARSLYGRSVALITCVSERTTQYNHKHFRSLVTVVYDHIQSFSPVVCYLYLLDCGLPPCPFMCIYCFLSMYLSTLMYALAPQHLMLCARQVVL